jgi:hypothetical protein
MGEEEDTLKKSLLKSFGSRGGRSKRTPPWCPREREKRRIKERR